MVKNSLFCSLMILCYNALINCSQDDYGREGQAGDKNAAENYRTAC